MTDRQRKVLVDAFLLLAAGARVGRRKAETETLQAVHAHVVEIEAMVKEVRASLEQSAGAGVVLARVDEVQRDLARPRAKTLSQSRPR